MPTYTFKCHDCQKTSAFLVKIENRNDPRLCYCGGTMQRQLDAPQKIYAPTRKL